MKKRLIMALIAWTVIYMVFFQLLPYLTDKYRGCYIHQDIYRQYIKSTVSDKYFDSKNHNARTIVFSNGRRFSGKMTFDGYYLEDLYDFLTIGDSVIKEKNSINYRVISEINRKDSIFKFETTCKDSIAKDSRQR